MGLFASCNAACFCYGGEVVNLRVYVGLPEICFERMRDVLPADVYSGVADKVSPFFSGHELEQELDDFRPANVEDVAASDVES